MSCRDFKKEKNPKCRKCNKYISKVPGYKKIIGDEIEASVASNAFNMNVIVGDVLCNICRRYSLQPEDSEATSLQNVDSPLYQNATVTPGPSSSLIQEMQQMSFESQSSSVSSSSSVKDPSFKPIGHPQWAMDTVELELPRVASSHGYCFICGLKNNIVNVPFEARKQIYSEKQIFVPKGNRCCSHHLMGNYLYTDDFENLNAKIVSNTSVIDVKDIKSFLEHSASTHSIISQISNGTFPDKKLHVLVGLNWRNIKEIAQMMTSIDKSVNVIEALCVFLFKLRTGSSNNVIAAMLGVNSSKVSAYCNKILQVFENDILPTQFGFGTIDREYLIENETSDIAKKLHGTNNELILIFDGTYVHHEKSQNNEYQRRSYSGQKKKPLCKPFTITTTNGFIVETLGPFSANLNDAQIMEYVLKQPNGLCTLMKPNDICVLDRGFRDVKQCLEEQGYRVLMPALKGNRKQLTVQEANDSRMVTKIRWVIEAIHGIIGRKFKLLLHQVDNKLLPNIKSYCRIASYLNNKYRLKSDDVLQDEILQQMFTRHSVENTLAIEVEDNRWNRRQAHFNVLSSQDLLDFTRMSNEELKVFFCGTYQLKQAISYLAEIMDDNNNIHVRYLKESNNIIRAEVKSRHINKKVYKCYIQYIPNSTGYHGIERHCCECANGNRTIGCCSHVAAIVYYLSKARFQSKIVRPAEILSKLFILDKLTPIINEDSDDD